MQSRSANPLPKLWLACDVWVNGAVGRVSSQMKLCLGSHVWV
jgi:hypothetical protein